MVKWNEIENGKSQYLRTNKLYFAKSSSVIDEGSFLNSTVLLLTVWSCPKPSAARFCMILTITEDGQEFPPKPICASYMDAKGPLESKMCFCLSVFGCTRCISCHKLQEMKDTVNKRLCGSPWVWTKASNQLLVNLEQKRSCFSQRWCPQIYIVGISYNFRRPNQ